MKIIIDADHGIYGRLCSYAAKQVLEGNEVVVVNSEKCVMTGKKEKIIEKYKKLRAKGGHSRKGPKYSKISSRILKKGIRGMLPDHRKGVGKKAFSNIRCYEGVPEKFANEKKIKMIKPKNDKYVDLKELSLRL